MLQPQILGELTSYAAWQALFDSNFFYIRETRVSQYDIIHSSYMPASGIIEYKSKQLIYGKYGMLNFLSKVFCDMTAEEKN